MTTQANQLIDIIAYEDVDYKYIALQFAKKYPDEFIGYHKNLKIEDNQSDWTVEYGKLMINGKKIAAIKLFKVNTNSSLANAKWFSDYIQFRLTLKGYPNKSGYDECSNITKIDVEYRYLIDKVMQSILSNN